MGKNVSYVEFWANYTFNLLENTDIKITFNISKNNRSLQLFL